ncbi:MAG: type II secretion system F family protein [Ruminococcus sp.]|nr:type II secretion system F family protein [Ruminococcus sp.]
MSSEEIETLDEEKGVELEKEKKPKKEKEPEYLTSMLNTRVLNYRVYYMNGKEKVLYTVLAFLAGAALGYLFYGGLGSDENGSPRPITFILDVVICTILGLAAVKFFLPVRAEQLNVKRLNSLRRQFMDLLDSLAASVASGNNAVKAFEAALDDLTMQYGEDANIVDELKLILHGQQNAIDIDVLLTDFGKRSGIREIESFAQVFALSYRRGGDFGKIIRDSYEILYSKLNIEMEIATKTAATRNELNIMMCAPVLLMILVKATGGDFAANFRTVMGVIAVTVGLVITGVAYYVGRRITEIEV